ncbi:MAG: RidA family protein [Nitrospinota bacterium]
MPVEDRLRQLGVALPAAPAPVGAYVPFVEARGLLFISGQLPVREGKLLHRGKLGAEVSLEEGKACARTCFLNALAQAKTALESLDRVKRVVRMTGYVASAPDFTDQAGVMNGASEFAVEVFGEGGKHARLAVGVAELPLGAPIELEVILEVN